MALPTYHYAAGFLKSWRWWAAVVVLLLLAACTDSGERSESAAYPAKPVSDPGAAVSASVFYVSNRRVDAGPPSVEAFTGERGDLKLGHCEAQFTPIKGLSSLASQVPFHIPSETKELVIEPQPRAAAFWEAVERSVRETSSQSLVLFVHGYSNSFSRTCLMAAELQRLLHGQATILMFSWPSNGRPTDYVADQADLEWSVPTLADLLSELGERFRPEKVQLLAHSLGSRGAIFALQRLAADHSERPLISRLVFLAPDFDSQTFVDLLPRLTPLTNGITLYASSRDTPLRVSEELNGHPRLGQAGESLTVAPGMETIDISPAGLYQILGHEYFYYHPQVAADLVQLVGSGMPAAERPGLEQRMRDGVKHWALLPQTETTAQ